MNYQKIYNQICSRAKSEFINGIRVKTNIKSSNFIYYEGHHIIPTCLGGEGRSYNWKHENICPLTGREHFIVHWLLHLIYPNNRKLGFAFDAMCKFSKKEHRYIPSSRIIEYSRKNYSKLISGENSHMKKPEFSGSNHPMKNPLIAKKVSDSNMGKFIGDKSPCFGKIGWSAGKKRPELVNRMLGDNNPAAKAVVQYDINGVFIKEWSNAAEAAKELEIQKSNISRVCTGLKYLDKKDRWWFYLEI